MASSLKQWREDQGLSQGELSERSGLDQSVISRLETGQRVATTGNLKRLKSVGVPPEILLLLVEGADKK